MNSLTKNYDAIIIGGGHNGLTAAAYLAKAGRRVLVLVSNTQFTPMWSVSYHQESFKNYNCPNMACM